MGFFVQPEINPNIGTPSPWVKHGVSITFDSDFAVLPIFDEEVSYISITDRFICSPGIIFKDGNISKSRPPQVNPNQLTKAQYEIYFEDMKSASENEPSVSKPKMTEFPDTPHHPKKRRQKHPKVPKQKRQIGLRKLSIKM
jgi:hypothetical protein